MRADPGSARPDRSRPRRAPSPCARRSGNGLVWASLGTPPHAPPAFPEGEETGFRHFFAGPYVYRANGFRAVENFLDATHFPFVHAGVNGVAAAPDPIPDYDVHSTATGIRSSEISVIQPYGDFRGVPIRAGYTYRVLRPLAAHFSKRDRDHRPGEGRSRRARRPLHHHADGAARR